MEIKMIAIAPKDGWAVILKENKNYLLRPPYTIDTLTEIPDKDLEIAVFSKNYDKCNFSFKSMQDIITYLNKQFYETNKKNLKSTFSSDERLNVLKCANDKLLLEFLNKAKRDFITRKDISIAEKIAFDLIGLEKVKKNIQLLNETIKFLFQIQEMKKKKMQYYEKEHKDLAKYWKKKFPNAYNKYDIDYLIKQQQLISGRKQILKVI